MGKPREFWIHQVIPENGSETFLAASKGRVEQDAWIGWQSLFIEKEAYDRAKEISRNLEHSVARLEKQNQILREALEHCRDFDTSAKFGYEYGQKVRGHIPEPGTRFKTPKEMAQQALADAEGVE